MSVPEFTLIIDDRDIKSFGIQLVGYKIQSYVGRKTLGVDIPGAHGTESVPSALSAGGFVANVIIVGQNSDEVHNRARQFFAYMYSTQNAHRMVFTDDLQVVRYAILNEPKEYNIIRGTDGALAELELSFYMSDPFTYQSDKDKLVKTVNHGVEVIIENDAYECPAVYTLENISDNQVTDVSLIVNGEIATFSCILNKGDKITLDTNEYEVMFNGEVRIDYWDGEMPLLKNGDNVIYHQNSQHSPMLLTIEFTKQWV